jgi:hypothetical protein
MKYGRGKWVFGAFLLAARDAARRFAFGHGSATGRRGSWRPLILRWRQLRRRQQELPAARVATSGSTLWFPKFHFHYATYLSNRKWRDRASGSIPATGVSETRVVLDHSRKHVRRAELPRQTHWAYRPLRPFHAGLGSRPKVDDGLSTTSGSSQPKVAHATAPPAAGRPPATPFGTRPQVLRARTKRKERSQPNIAHTTAPPAAGRPPATRFGTMPQVLRARTKTKERSQPFQTQPRIWQHWLQIFCARPPMHGDRLPLHSPEHKAVRVRFDPTEELVWRRAKRPPTEVVDLEQPQATFDSFDSPAVRSFPGQEVVNSSPSSERAALLPITQLDPSFVDRLTDDVIRRVEKRARIERQRRGL